MLSPEVKRCICSVFCYVFLTGFQICDIIESAGKLSLTHFSSCHGNSISIANGKPVIPIPPKKVCYLLRSKDAFAASFVMFF